MDFNSQLHQVTFLSLLLLVQLSAASAQDAAVTPVKIQLTADRTQFDVGDSTQAILILRNTTAYTLTNVSIELKGTAFSVVSSTPRPNTLSPYRSFEVEYTLKSLSAGSQNIIFTLRYSWDDPNTKLKHHRIEIASVEKIEVKSRSIFDLPQYLIPLISLLLGFFIGQLGAWLTDWRKQRIEKKAREEQAKGVTLAILQAIRKGVNTQEPVSFSLWEDAIVKGNLYSALHQFGRAIRKPELSKRLAELSITLADYNERQAANNLTQTLTGNLERELNDLIQIIENQS